MNVGDSSGERSQEFDLNLAPIIDCFTVLITFMLASASFLAIGIFDTSVAAPGQAAKDAKPPSINIEIELTALKEIHFNVNGQTKATKQIPAQGGEYNKEVLVAEVEAYKRKYPDVTSVTLSAADDVQYLQLIAVMDSLKSHIPTTLLGGF